MAHYVNGRTAICGIFLHNSCANTLFSIHSEPVSMWTKPAFEDLRIGFEVTMYFSHR
jgi:coenzyme PQQ precursor peptide PqqA